MKFNELQVDGFGVWSGLSLQSLSPELCVIFGANEAGKTTLLECLRGVLYGFTPARRDRYLPPVHGGEGGGTLDLCVDGRSYSVARRDDGSRRLGGVTVTLPDGSIEGDARLAELRCDIDEAAFVNLFTVGLRELQELATLNEQEAARWLYDLSTGLEGVSLGDTLRELRNSRARLISPSDDKGTVIELLSQRDALQGEISQLQTLHDRYWSLVAEQLAAEQQITIAEGALATASAELARLDAASAVRRPWHERITVEQKIAAYGRLGDFPSDALRRLQSILTALRHARRKRAQIKTRRDQIRDARRQIQFNERLWRHAPRIAALAENEPWIASLEEQLRAAEEKVTRLERHLADERLKHSLPDNAWAGASGLSSAVSSQLREPARRVRAARKQFTATRDEYRTLQHARGAGHDEVGAALAGRGESSLAAALEKQGALVAKYRRRLQLDDRLDQMALYRQELEERHASLSQRQIVPLWLLIVLAVVFVAGGGLVLAGLIIPWGSATAIIGAMIACGAFASKKGWEGSAARQLGDTEKQLKMLDRQVQQAKADRDELDGELPSGGGALASRLQTAETELAALEELLSADARRQSGEDAISGAKARLRQASEAWRRAKQAWRQSLMRAGLAPELRPGQVKELLSRSGVLQEIQTQLNEARNERDRARREIGAVAARIEQLTRDAGWAADSGGAKKVSLIEQLRRLRQELVVQEECVEQRRKLDARLKRLRRHGAKYARRARRLAGRRRALYRAAGALDKNDFRRRADERRQLDELLRRRGELGLQLQAAFENGLAEQELAALFTLPAGELEARREKLSAERDRAVSEVKRLSEHCGRLAHQQQLLQDDRSLAVKQVELSVVEERLADAVARFRTLALTESLIESVKEDYERNRQPEVLEQASKYLWQMTEGRYGRVWTPLDEQTLRVDDSDGRSLPIERLSTGAREQLFLCLRLALVRRFANSGKSMPMVLDDVLVNFDKQRAAAAAAVFADFAAAGHQLLLFTCHEHIADLFRTLRCDVRTLPANSDASRKIVGPAIGNGDTSAETPKRRRDKRTKEQAVTIHPEPPVELVEPPAAIPDDIPAITFDATEPDSGEFHPPAVEIHPPPIYVQPPAVVEAIAPVNGHRHHRADPPQRIMPMTIRRRWSAEEFDGELEDQVNIALVNESWGRAIG
jgi:uncharacterized protein YhaN